MTLRLLLALTLGTAAVAALVGRRWPRLARAVGFAGLAAAAAIALRPADNAPLIVADGQLLLTPYGALWTLAAAAALALLLVLDELIAPDGQPVSHLAPALAAAALAAMAAALAVADPGAALLVLAAAAAVAPVAALRGLLRPVGSIDGLASLRMVAAAATAALLAIAWLGSPSAPLEPVTLATGGLLLVAAVALRLGTLPFHLPTLRLAGALPRSSVPLVAAWLPAAFAVVAGAWAGTLVGPLVETTPARAVAVAIVMLTLAGTSAAMLAEDDLAHLLGYSILQDGALGLLGSVLGGPADATATREWLLLFALGKSATAAVVVGLEAAFGSRRLADLDGWLRRAPLLGGALLVALLVTYGLPGTLPWEARRTLLVDAAGDAGGALGLGLAGLSLLAWLRFAWRGLRRPGASVVAGAGERPRRPAGAPTAAAGRPPAARSRPRAAAGGLAAAGWLAAAAGLNRVPLAHLVALTLALLSLALALGAGGLAAAAAGPWPTPPVAE